MLINDLYWYKIYKKNGFYPQTTRNLKSRLREERKLSLLTIDVLEKYYIVKKTKKGEFR
mgnify:CR=1 FL=1